MIDVLPLLSIEICIKFMEPIILIRVIKYGKSLAGVKVAVVLIKIKTAQFLIYRGSQVESLVA